MTPEETIAEICRGIADELALPGKVTVTCKKPTPQEIWEHQLRTGQLYFGVVPQGIEPKPFVRWLRKE